MSLKPAIISQIQQVAREQKRTLAPLSDDLALQESGLDSLCWAIIVARLESTLGLDPFGADDEAELPITLGDFIRVYEDAPG